MESRDLDSIRAQTVHLCCQQSSTIGKFPQLGTGSSLIDDGVERRGGFRGSTRWGCKKLETSPGLGFRGESRLDGRLKGRIVD